VQVRWRWKHEEKGLQMNDTNETEGIVIFGAGKIAEVAHGYFSRDDARPIKAFTCDRSHCGSGIHLGLPLVPFDEIAVRFPPSRFQMFVAIGYHQMNALRADRCAQARALGYRLASYVAPSAWLPAGVAHGDNSLVLDGVTVQPGAKLGRNVALWSGVVVGHHTTVQDDCWLAAGATIGGGSVIGEASFVGLNATIGHEVTVGRRCLLGARTLVTKSLPDERVVADADSNVLRLESGRFLQISKLT
jgi:sugar O-acyltransferase (sialic acid O-acetyltransferase NeuD family)